MNKKFSTLVAAFLAATSFGASAQTLVNGTAPNVLTKGQYYLLGTTASNSSAGYLFLDGDSLITVDQTALTAKTALTRSYGQWKVEFANGIDGKPVYTFTNKATGAKLALPASGKAVVAGGPVNSFKWQDDVTSTGTVAALTNGAVAGGTYTINKVFVLGEDVTADASSTVAALASKGFWHYEVMIKSDVTGVTAGAESGLTKAASQDVDAALTAAKALKGKLAGIGAATDKIDALITAIESFTQGSGVDLSQSADATKFDNAYTPAKTALATQIDALNEYHLSAVKNALSITNTTTPGTPAEAEVATYYVATATTALGGDGSINKKNTYKKGSKFIVKSDQTESKALELVPYIVGTKEFANNANTEAPATQITVLTGTEAGGTVVAIADDADAVSPNFAKEFKKGTEADKEVYVEFGFEEMDPAIKDNLLAGKKFQVVQRNLFLKAADGGYVATGATAGADKVNYSKATLLKVVGEDKYLVVEENQWDNADGSNPSSTYYKLNLASLSEISSRTSMTGASADSKAKFWRGNGYHSAAYVFDVQYDVEKDAVKIYPQYIVSKVDKNKPGFKDDKDTLGVNLTTALNSKAQIISAKMFATENRMTLVPASGKVYRISTTGSTPDVPSLTTTTKPTGLYLVQYISDLASNKADNGKYFVSSRLTDGSAIKLVAQEEQNFNNMPAAQWIIKKAASGLVSIKNRENGKVLETAAIGKFENVQLYAGATDEQVFVYGKDTLKLTQIIGDAAVKDSLMGYYYGEPEALKYKKFALNYFHALNADKCIAMNEDSTLFVDPEGNQLFFAIEPTTEKPVEYYAGEKENKAVVVKNLKRYAYRVYASAANAIAKGDTLFVVEENGALRLQKTKPENAATFHVMEYNVQKVNAETKAVETKTYYAFFEASNTYKMGVNDRLSTMPLTAEKLTEERTSTFAMVGEPAPEYRRLGETIKGDNFTDLTTDTAKFYVSRNDVRYLYENSVNAIAGTGKEEGLKWLGEVNTTQFTGENAKNLGIFVDTAYVRDNTPMPQYMLALRPQFGKFIDCPVDPSHPAHYVHQVKADYLVALVDSVAAYNGKEALKFQFEEATRLAFVPAIHHVDTLLILSSKYTGNNTQIEKDKAATYAGKDSIQLGNDKVLNAATFAFRLVDRNSDTGDFYIETVKDANKQPQYIRLENGVPVLTNDLVKAERFNINRTDESAVANDEISTTEVTVSTIDGAVVVKGAAGKKVTISNVLGQTIANTVLSSDEATIAVPKGYVTVVVEGEAAVKAIIK